MTIPGPFHFAGLQSAQTVAHPPLQICIRSCRPSSVFIIY